LASYVARSSKFKIQSSKLQFKVQSLGFVGLILRRLAYYDSTGYGYILHDNIFDRWASGQLEPCDIFHGWNHHCLWQLRAAKKFKATTVVERASSHILHGQEILEEEYRKYNVRGSFWPQRYIQKSLKEYDEADFILVPSDYAYQSFVDQGFNERRLVRVPFGVKVRPSQRSDLSFDKGKFIVLYVGEIRLGKGVQYLLEAWDALGLNDAELWLVGEVKSDIKKIVSRYKDRADIKFWGFRKDVPELMARANAFVFPSLDEGSARVTYEAMASGLPVITTPNAGSLVRDSIDGYIVPIRDSDALAERINYYHRYPSRAEEMGGNGRERIREFSWEKYGEELVKAYIRMLK
jgi:glycosyltransferase involved in cell wall biosynthesis